MDISLFNINNTKNYNSKLNEDYFQNYFKDICSLMSEFLIYTIDNVNVQNNKYYLFVIRRGLETIAHCYKFLLLYTRNYELALYHCKKAYIYYVEFIGQIGYNNNSFLQLNSKDATLFVYKKTIFDIINSERKNHILDPEEKHLILSISTIINIYIKITIIILESQLKEDKLIAPIIQFCTKNCMKIIDNIYISKEEATQTQSRIQNITYFIEEMQTKNIDNIVFFFNIINCFVKKYKKYSITKQKINSKLISPDFQRYLDLNSHLKLINWIFT